MVNRTIEVDDKKWAELHKNSQQTPQTKEDVVKVSKAVKGSERYLYTCASVYLVH